MSRFFRLLFFILLILVSSGAWAAPVRLAIGMFTGNPGESVTMPITIEGAVGQNVLAYKIILSFNPTVLKFKSLSVKGTVIATWGNPTFNAQEDRIIMVGGGVRAIAQDGTLLFITFDVRVDAVPGARSNLVFVGPNNPNDTRLNEGVPQVSTISGVFTVAGGTGEVGVRLSVGTASGRAGGSVVVPVAISGTTGEKVTSAKVTVTYDPKALTFKDVSFEGTVAEVWGSPLTTHKEGETTVVGGSVLPLNGDGQFVMIRFDVKVDAPLGESKVALKEVILNEGALVASTSNGMITIIAGPSGQLKASIEQISADPGDSVVVPVKIQGAPGRDILAFTFDLLYDHRLLMPVNASFEGTVVEGWPEPVFRGAGDSLAIAAAGVSPIETDGILLKIIFVVSQEAQVSKKSPISFLTTSFESLTQAEPFQAITEDGSVTIGSTAVDDEDVFGAVHPQSYLLRQNYPNPFNPYTTISYGLPESAYVKLEVYNITGEVIKTLVDTTKSSGLYAVVWNGRSEAEMPVSSGIYFYRLSTGAVTKIRKMTLIR